MRTALSGSWRRLALGAVALLAVTSCSGTGGNGSSATSPAASPTQPLTGYVRVEPAAEKVAAVDLEYRDYGGTGQPVVLLTGLGDTAGVFDQLAPMLRDQGHRVVALTRRGFGASSKTGTGYDIGTRTRDDARAIAALGLERPIVIGHSIAGDELIGLATDSADRIAGVVSLDAMIDRGPGSGLPAANACAAKIPQPKQPPFDPADPYGSLQAQQEAILGFPVGNGTANLRALYALTDSEPADTAEPTAVEHILAGATKRPPAFADMRAPMLAIFSINTVATLFPGLGDADPDLLRQAERCVRLIDKVRDDTITELEQVQPEATIQRWDGAHHYQFLQWPERTADVIGDWIRTLPGS